jgi:hypothetical protein
VACAADHQLDIGAATHRDLLAADLEGARPLWRQVAVAGAIDEALDVEVLHVGHHVGDAPGDTIVAPDHDAGQARNRGADDVARRCAHMGEIPDRRIGDQQMRVVGQQWLAAGAACTRDDPVVRCRRSGRQCRSEGRHALPVEVAVERSELWRRTARAILGIVQQQPVDLLGREAGSQPGPHDLLLDVGRETPGHDHQPGERVGWLPRGRAQAECDELRRQCAAMAGEEGVHTRGIALERGAAFGIEPGNRGLGSAIEADGAHLPIDDQCAISGQLGETAGADAALQLELPEPVLRMRKAQAEGSVAVVVGGDVRHAVGVTHDGDGPFETGHADVTVEPRQRGGEMAPAVDPGADDHQQQHAEDAQGPAPAAAGIDAPARRMGLDLDRRHFCLARPVRVPAAL